MPDGSDNAIRLRNLGRDYGERPALEGIELDLPEGSSLAVLGPNGSGKSTLLRVLATLLRPSRGEVEVLGCSLPNDSWKLRGRIGYLGHEPLLYEDLTGRENLEFQARLYGIPAGLAAERIESDLGTLGMGRRANYRVSDYSAGMKQRIAICRAVLHRPALLLLDEPESNLDPEGREAARSLIGHPGQLAWGSEAPVTRVAVSHEPEKAREESDRVLELAIGGVVA
ncbi:MAG: ABC transporter ATP-binding protein [Solirubrobacterales bacterium]|nr:ABC transporter ATP-binding protein [Solirubrobacterales bacterium]MCB0860670.1 ABC transporter ATP-binding protein [Solirubrobacterales bacterium]